LEEKPAGSKTWTEIDSQAVDKNLVATFPVEGLTTNTMFRIGFKGTYSAEVTVLVTPKLTLRVDPPDIMRSRKTTLSGILRPKLPGRSVALQRRVGGEWRGVGRLSNFGLTYEKTIEPETHGKGLVRAVFEGDEFNAAKSVAKRLWVYKPSLTTWYGPGFFGNKTACGQRLRRNTLGVAHRKLPCGTNVHVFYKGKTISVDVIDRGPFTNANWDLTQETAERVGFAGKERLGFLVDR
jgi:rare lipoprotein A